MNRKTHLAPQIESIVIVGTGGTGSYLAQGLAKLVAGYRLQVGVLLVDPDTVEEKNCSRQNFHHYEIGEHKAPALAYRLNQQYGVSFAALVGRGEDQLQYGYVAKGTTFACSHGFQSPGAPRKKQVAKDMSRLVVTCVDSLEARKFYHGCGPWLDLGNGIETGQAIYGTTENRKMLRSQVEKWVKQPHVGHLPSPYLVAGMKKLKPGKEPTPGCADHPFAEQGIWANEWAAAAGLTILHQLLVKGEVATPAIYFDTSKGRMAPQFITREYLKGA